MKIRRNKDKEQGNYQHRYVLVVLLFFLSACGGGSSGSSTVSSSGAGAIAFSVAWEAPATDRRAAGLVQTLAATELDCQDVGVTTVEAKVYDENGTLLSTGGPWPCNQHSGTIEGVAAGHNIKVAILGKSGNDIMYRGEAAPITVHDGETSDIAEPITATSFVPVNLSPANDTRFTSSGSAQALVTLGCNAIPGASTYHFLLATDSDFTSAIQEIIEPTGVASVSLDAGTYFWKVGVTDQYGNQGGWSETLSFTVTGAVVSFQDPNLEAAVREALNKPDGELTTGELQTVTTLSAGSKNITNLNGIQNLTQLNFLDLDSNQISDISPLQNLTQLTYLYLSENQISNITPLQNLTILSNLFLYDNQISNISILQNLTQLTWLFLSGNQISDISPLQNLTQLTNLGLSNNQISDITALQNLTQLVELFISINQISDISPLQNLTQLTEVSLSVNCITDFSPVDHVANVSGKDNQGACGIVAPSDCATLSGLWCGQWSETSCDGLTYSGNWEGEIDSGCSFYGLSEWEFVNGSIDPTTKILTASGVSVEGCGTITLNGAIDGDSIAGTYSYSLGGSGSFIGTPCD